MPDHAVRERPYRMRARSREEPKPDTITTALTAQVIVCVILLLFAFGAKKLDAAKYTEVKAQFTSMLRDKNQTDKAIEWFSDSEGIFGGISGAFERYVSGILPKRPKQEVLGQSEPANEPLDGQETGTQLDFDYIGKAKEDAVYMAASGGLFPVEIGGDGMLPPPEGSTLSPVYLGAKIKPPVTGTITSGFAYRYHPMTGNRDFHTGIDVAAEEGRAILAALPGKVVEVGESEIYGNYIVLEHAANLKTSYSHCSEIIASEGMSVRQGERIALVGETGTATGPHLHFSVIVEDEFTDPAWILNDYIRLVE